MRRRNPDEQAYRAWQADHSDRGALQRYLSSMARDQEVLDDPERIVELDEAVGQDGALRPIYARVRPDYSNEETSFREERWRTLVDRYAGRQLDPRAVLILVEMGLRSGISMEKVFSDIHKGHLISQEVFGNAVSSRHHPHWYVRRSCIETLGSIGMAAVPAIPQIIHSLKNDEIYAVRGACAEAIGNIGVPAANSCIDVLIRIVESTDDWYVRSCSLRSLVKMVPDLAIYHLISGMNNYDQEAVSYRSNCVSHLCEIDPIIATLAIPQLINVLRVGMEWVDSFNCAIALGRIGPAALSAVPQLINSMNNDEVKEVSDACREAIEKITGERPL